MKKLKVILLGAGSRGIAYTDLMVNDRERFEVVAVADPNKARNKYVQDKHNISDSMCFDSWEEVLNLEKFADVVLVCTMDKMHYEPVMAAIEKGYDLLLEKPVAPTPEECIKIKKAAEEKNVKILVCHVLRYAPFFMKVKEIIDSGKLGRIISIEHDECVGDIHQTHSFVRGNWGNSKNSSSMLLQKCCHDIDVLQWFIGKKCKRVQSFGSLTYFNEDNAPKGAPTYCAEGCPVGETCYYNAVKLYHDSHDDVWFRSAAAKKYDPTDEEIWKAITTTQYGKCVFKCDNDVVDHQVVNMEFEDGCLVSFHMSAFNEGGRHIRIMGTKGELIGAAGKRMLDFFSFDTREHEEIDTKATVLGETLVSGHGGGDTGIINTLYSYLTDKIGAEGLSEIGISVDNHMITFAAEESRLIGSVVDVDEYTNRF